MACTLLLLFYFSLHPISQAVEGSFTLDLNGTVEVLTRNWTKAYGLKEGERNVEMLDDPFFIRAPHLRDCVRLNEQAENEQSRGPNGELPKWIKMNSRESVSVKAILNRKLIVRPPWIKGDDDDNLILTREAQAAIWLHQHPQNCSSPAVKFLVADFWGLGAHGIGSQLNGISTLLAFAIQNERVLVLTKSFRRAKHSGCKGKNFGKFECYFFPVTSPQCSQEAQKNFSSKSSKHFKNDRGNQERVWYLGAHYGSFYNKICPSLFCTGVPRDRTDEVQGKLKNTKMDWWRAQSIRYLLRTPSLHLCEVENLERQVIFGAELAVKVARAIGRMRKISSESEFPTVFQGSLESSEWSPHSPPFLPRPIVSVHLRGGAKKREMSIWPLRSLMEQAERIRRFNPQLKNVWLASMFESTIRESKLYRNWRFFYTRQPRIPKSKESHQIDDLEDPKVPRGSPVMERYRRGIELSFVNLQIQQECDFFIGTLGSNWDRIINGLRKTNGRLHSGYVSLNRANSP